MSILHNVNLKPLTEVKKWDTKRINAYKDRIQKHISFVKSGQLYEQDNYSLMPEQQKNQFDVDLERFINYNEELKKILATREHLQ